MTADDELREYAARRLKRQAAFKNYLWTWLGVSLLTSAIWFFTSPSQYFWPGWVIFGMGVGALFSGIDAYRTRDPRMITAEAIDAEVERLKVKKKP
jgi:hypothetical protein